MEIIANLIKDAGLIVNSDIWTRYLGSVIFTKRHKHAFYFPPLAGGTEEGDKIDDIPSSRSFWIKVFTESTI